VTAPEVELRRTWRRVAAEHSTAPLDEAFERLMARHREPHRRYHTATHVMWVVRHVDRLLAELDPDGRCDAGAIRAAALFHDAVYDPHSATNEHDSAVWASEVLAAAGWPPARVARVAELIEATAHLGPPSPPAGSGAGTELGGSAGAENEVEALETAVLLDADLAILGADPNDYRAYVAGVRAEYAHVDEPGWRTGRAAVLHSLLEHDPLFRTAPMRTERERRARANLSAELAGLRHA
jgi:predicted metal-dependent HD superfamily phosphohydrolase